MSERVYGLRVAALLKAVEARASKARSLARSGDHEDGKETGFTAAADLIRQHIGEPTPEERAATEVIAALPAIMQMDGNPGSPARVLRHIARECRHPASRVGFRTIAALALAGTLAGTLACDAVTEQKGGA